MSISSPLILGHRGASSDLPGNSVRAFLAAVEAGADGVELDVRRLADGGLACSHDERLVDGRALLELTADDLPPDVPLLTEALDACRPLSLVNVELKNLPGEGDFDDTEQLAEAVVDLLAQRGELDDGRILLSSFHRRSVDRVRELAPTAATGWVLYDARDFAPLIERTVAGGHQAIHPHHAFVNAELVDAAHAAGLTVTTWTCDDPDRLRWLAEVGVDGIICNDPAAGLRALGR
ncbi:MAG: glycerophosphodiester phosphodiesterase [Actinomycetota bacterium]|nr:glycerophosphodiester phosphodiesterase [Actinomycetota bacterium]